MSKIYQIAKKMTHLDVQSQSLQVPLDLVPLFFSELKIELERLERTEIFCNGYFH